MYFSIFFDFCILQFSTLEYGLPITFSYSLTLTLLLLFSYCLTLLLPLVLKVYSFDHATVGYGSIKNSWLLCLSGGRPTCSYQVKFIQRIEKTLNGVLNINISIMGASSVQSVRKSMLIKISQPTRYLILKFVNSVLNEEDSLVKFIEVFPAFLSHFL